MRDNQTPALTRAIRSADAINEDLSDLNAELQRIKAKIDARLAELQAARAGDLHKKAKGEQQGA